jgi:DNA-binding beta-propeller fold protein YncE
MKQARMRALRSCVVVATVVVFVRLAAAGPFVPVGGGAYTVSIDSTGTFAYAANDSLVAVLDIAARRVVRQFPTIGVSDAGALDPSGMLLPVFGFDVAGVVDVATGLQRALVTATGSRRGAYYAATIANGKLYAAAFNGRAVHVAQLSGGEPVVINPYVGQPNVVATPCEVAAAPDGTTVLMGEELRGVVSGRQRRAGHLVGEHGSLRTIKPRRSDGRWYRASCPRAKAAPGGGRRPGR